MHHFVVWTERCPMYYTRYNCVKCIQYIQTACKLYGIMRHWRRGNRDVETRMSLNGNWFSDIHNYWLTDWLTDWPVQRLTECCAANGQLIKQHQLLTRFKYNILANCPGRRLTLPWHGEKYVCKPYTKSWSLTQTHNWYQYNMVTNTDASFYATITWSLT